MAQPVEYNESRGDMDAHIALMGQRVANAKAEYDRARERGINPAMIESTRMAWEAAQAEYDRFLTGASPDIDTPEVTS